MAERQHLSRERVLEVIADRFGHSDFSTRELAEVLGVTEPQVRGALGWLVHARILHAVGGVRRLDCCQRPYRATLYRWTGKQIPPDPPGCRRSRPNALAAEWLARRW